MPADHDPIPKFVTPETFLVGCTRLEEKGIQDYLDFTGQQEFLKYIEDAKESGIEGSEILCSFYSKLCYASLVPGENENIKGVRSIGANLIATMDSGHGSVFEHVFLNFVTTNCSRIMTHELVRHRTGTAFSQTSGRYVRKDSVDIVWDPILEKARKACEFKLHTDRMFMLNLTILMGMASEEQLVEAYRRTANPEIFLQMTKEVENYAVVVDEENKIVNFKVTPLPFDQKKKLTSAMRRFLPEGRPNEIGWSVNIRQLRHMITLRTSRHAEWEIRKVFYDVFKLVQQKFPVLFHDAKVRDVDGVGEVYGMTLQPYDKPAE